MNIQVKPPSRAKNLYRVFWVILNGEEEFPRNKTVWAKNAEAACEAIIKRFETDGITEFMIVKTERE